MRSAAPPRPIGEPGRTNQAGRSYRGLRPNSGRGSAFARGDQQRLRHTVAFTPAKETNPTATPTPGATAYATTDPSHDASWGRHREMPKFTAETAPEATTVPPHAPRAGEILKPPRALPRIHPPSIMRAQQN